MISVITPSVRIQGLSLVKKALKRQLFKNFQWLIVTPVPSVEVTRILDNYPYIYIDEPQKQTGDYWTLNKAMNKAIAKAKGELVVSWQDWTYARPDALEKFWFHYQQEPRTLVTGVGNKYADESWTVRSWQDPRERDDQGTYYPCYFNDIEFNFCSVPKDAFYAVGGYDEYLDRFAGMDGYSVVSRLNLLGGWDFKIDQTNKSFSLEHGRLPEWEYKNAIHGEYKKREAIYVHNPVLSYLAK